eukprot:scaffold147310_cov19-Tisochrysis_lutea.AAC.2
MGKYAHRRDLLKVLLARCEQCNRLDLFFVEEEYMNDDERLCLRQYLRMVVDTLYMATHLRDGVPACEPRSCIKFQPRITSCN